MAVHYTERAALLPLPASKKLVLMCIADSANMGDRVGFPGHDAISAWSGIKSRSRVLELIAELIAEGLLVRKAYGVKGRRAEYAVFPQGCCAEHGPLPGLAAAPAPDVSDDDGESLGDDDSLGSAVADGTAKGPAKGPAQGGPLHISTPPPLTSGTTSREQGSDSGQPTPPSLPSENVSAPPRVRRSPLPPTAHLDPRPPTPPGPAAELGGPGHAAFVRARLVLACGLCDSVGLLPSGVACTHPRRDEAAAG